MKPNIQNIKDAINNIDPPHYRNHPSGIECIQITEHMGFNLGNALKYIWRSDEKHDDPTEDMNKSIWYIIREMKKRGLSCDFDKKLKRDRK